MTAMSATDDVVTRLHRTRAALEEGIHVDSRSRLLVLQSLTVIAEELASTRGLCQAIIERLNEQRMTQQGSAESRTAKDSQLPKLLTIQDAARVLRCCAETVRRACKFGTLPSTRVGKLVRINATDLERWRAAGGQTTS
jgi:excisionase family DNA binding protein